MESSILHVWNIWNHEYLFLLGGGPPRKQNEDPAIDRVIDLIQARVSGFTNIYDSDGTNIGELCKYIDYRTRLSSSLLTFK